MVVKDTEHILGVESATYTRQDEATSDVAAFENHYQPGEAAYAPRVTKHLSGDKTPSNATFTFTMQAHADNPEGAAVEGTSASVAGAGQTAFAPITFTKAGTYRFDIREADGHEAGYTYDNVVKSTCLLGDMSYFGEMNEVYAKYYKTDCPARAAFAVKGLPMGAMVEIEAIAVK